MPQPHALAAPSPQPMAPELLLSSGRWELEAVGGALLQPTLAPDPIIEARALMEELRRSESESGRAHLIHGLIPFDLDEPACLGMTDAAVRRPRRWRTGAVPDDGVRAHGGRCDAATAPGPAPVEPAARDDPAFRSKVSACLDHLRSGALKKVVLSRWVDFPLPPRSTPDHLAEQILERLSVHEHLAADVYHVRDCQGQHWVGASPELVADVHDGLLVSHPLAGSLPRSAAEDDREAARLLRASAKDLHEHALVVEHIRTALGGFAHDLVVPASPSVIATDTMWHLGTRISGRLPRGTGALEAALRIHPTPAVCGSPTAPASRLIKELEGDGRHFYTGLVGWTDSVGDGRWSLVLRGARVNGDSIRIQAGAGIVPGSSPALEHEETGAKLSTMLRALRGLPLSAP